MDPSTQQLFMVVALLGTNNVVFRIPGWDRRPAIFWSLQLLNLGALIYLLAVGIPGFAGVTNAINWVLGLLFILHIVTNNSRYDRARRGRTPDLKSRNERRQQVRAALRRGEE